MLDLPVAKVIKTLQRLISSSRLIFSAADWLLKEQEEMSLKMAERLFWV